jgi:putative redox protein
MIAALLTPVVVANLNRLTHHAPAYRIALHPYVIEEPRMTIKITRDRTGKMKHRIRIRGHELIADEGPDNGGEDAGPNPHDLYDSAIGACKALTVLWYANRKQIPVDNIEVIVERDASRERDGIYRLKTLLAITGELTEAQREQLLNVAGKCPIHKLMSQVTTEIETGWL